MRTVSLLVMQNVLDEEKQKQKMKVLEKQGTFYNFIKLV